MRKKQNIRYFINLQIKKISHQNLLHYNWMVTSLRKWENPLKFLDVILDEDLTWKKNMYNLLKLRYQKTSVFFMKHVKLIFYLVLHGKNSMRDALKSFCFWKKSNVLFILSNCHRNAFLWKNLMGKSLWIAISPIKKWKCITVHNCTFKIPLFYFFRLNWVGCLFHRKTSIFRMQTFLYHNVP